jgi:uncharacterized protein (DUF1015 family)
MARFEPFAGLRYDASLPLDDLVAPPYDVVGIEERAVLGRRHPANAIHVELPADDPEGGLDRYRAAARLFTEWTSRGILRPEEGPGFYTYRMTEADGRSTTGVIGALECRPGGGDVLPHEQTIPKDMTDRLELLRACRINTSPIWGLSLAEDLAETYVQEGPPTASATDDAGVKHDLWTVRRPRALELISTKVGSAPVVIADGHHRYETALAYRAERHQAKGDSPADCDLVMALVVELSERQLSVGAIHRLLRGVPGDLDLLALFGRWFESEGLGHPDLSSVERLLANNEMGLVTAHGVWRLVPKDAAFTRAGSDLDSSLVELVLADSPVKVEYLHDARRAFEEVESSVADALVVLRPVTVAQIAGWARQGRRMPPKSTYFHPKPRTGMVFRPLAS